MPVHNGKYGGTEAHKYAGYAHYVQEQIVYVECKFQWLNWSMQVCIMDLLFNSKQVLLVKEADTEHHSWVWFDFF